MSPENGYEASFRVLRLLPAAGLAKDGCKAPAALAVFQSVRAARAAVAALHGQKVAGEVVWARELGGEVRPLPRPLKVSGGIR